MWIECNLQHIDMIISETFPGLHFPCGIVMDWVLGVNMSSAFVKQRSVIKMSDQAYTHKRVMSML
jgi:hypothetical protein